MNITTNTNKPQLIVPRRKFLTLAMVGSAAVAGSAFSVNYSRAMDKPGEFAEALLQTPQMAEGPFYPDKLPLDTDNDLLILNDSITPAVGEITHLSGRVLTTAGSPVRNAFVEIWQVDNRGVYLHNRSAGAKQGDTNFQGYGRFLTNRKGEYYFRTIKPVSYPGRTPHIHFAVSMNGHRVLTTQMLTRDNAANERDGLFKRFKDEQSRAAITAVYTPLPDSKINELVVEHDLVLGITPDEHAASPVTGGIAKPNRK
jgi:protocatechuate 3,4-dioxygenase beta subunit